MPKMSDAQIVALIEAEESEALGLDDDELSSDRADALDRYNQRPYGWEVEGRSQFVSNAIRDQIEAIMPSIARVFLSGDEIGRFDAIGQEDEASAERESLVVNHCVTKGGGWQAIYSATKDALLLKNGYILVNWKKDESVVSESYQGQSDEELAILLQDGDVKVVEHTEYPVPGWTPMIDPATGMEVPAPMLHDVRVERVKPEEGLDLQAIPPDEVIVSEKHRSVSLMNSDFVQLRREVTIGELREAGYKVPDDIADDGEDSEEEIARARYSWREQGNDDASPDPTRRRVLYRENWIKAALDGEEVPKLYKVCIVGRKVLRKEPADMIPIAAFAPIWYPHSHIGVSFYDLLKDLAEAETVVSRQYFDSLYLSTANRMIVDPARVSLDDLLVSRPGGIVRVEGDPSTAVMPLVATDIGPTAQAGLEWIAQQRENRTGMARVNQGSLDPNALNRTATGAQMMMTAGQARLEAAARLLAEGVKDLFLICHAMLLKHSTKPIQLKLKNDWIAVNPREWARRSDFSVSVALGTGTPEAQLGKLQLLAQQVPMYMQLGLMGPREIYNLGAETLRVSGYRTPQKFLIEPPEGAQMPQPGPPPEVMAAQAQGQALVQKATVDGQVELQKVQVVQTQENQRNLVDNATKVLIAQMQGARADFNADKDRALGEAGAMRERQYAEQDAEAQREHDANMAQIQAAIQKQAQRMQ